MGETKKHRRYGFIPSVLVAIVILYLTFNNIQQIKKINDLEYEILKQKIELDEAYIERDRAIELENLLRKGKADLKSKLEECEKGK